MAHKGYDKNEFGTLISKHTCDACGEDFTVCPAQHPESKGWDNCLAPNCKSYDAARDVDKMIGEGKCAIRQAPPKGQA